MPKVSIIVPVYKVEQYLKRCVDSLINQTLTDIEIILVDDGSPDNCPTLCDEFAKKDSRIKVIHKQNGGVSTARNLGLDLAVGEYIAFVDSDDYVESDMYSSMLKIAVDNKCDFVMCDCIKEYYNKNIIYSHTIREGFYSKEDLIKEYYPHLLIMENVEYPATISNWLFLFKKELIQNTEIRYPVGIKYSEDWLFGAKLMYAADSFYYMKSKAFYHYCMNPNSVTHVFDAKKWENYLKIYNLAYAYFISIDNYDFSGQLDLMLLFFVYNALGDLKNHSGYEKQQLLNEMNVILKNKKVINMFKNINIFKLAIPFKQKILTLFMKIRFAKLLSVI